MRPMLFLLVGLLLGVVAGHEYARMRTGPESADRFDAGRGRAVDGRPGVVVAAVPEAAGGDAFARLDALAASRDVPAIVLADALAIAGMVDARRAAERAVVLELPPDLQAAALERLAQSDPDAALALLARMEAPAARRAAAGRLLLALGADGAALAQVFAALPAVSDAAVIRGEAFAVLAGADPDAALELALAEVGSAARQEALRRVAEAWARTAPREALARIGRIADPDAARRFEEAILETWAGVAPEAALERLGELVDAGDERWQLRSLVLRAAARRAPAAALAFAERIAGGSGLEFTVLDVWAGQDPAAALAAFERTIPPAMQAMYVSAIARSAASADPEAALRWALARSEEQGRALGGVLAELGDLDRALAIVATVEQPQERQQALLGFALQAALGTSQREVAERLLAANDPFARSVVPQVLQGWAQRAPEEVVAWYLDAPDERPGGWFAQAAGSIAVRDPARSVALMERLPEADQAQWFAATVGALARADEPAALALLDRRRGTPGHGEAVAALVATALRADAVRAAELAERYALLEVRPDMASTIAARWATADADAAMSWAEGLASEAARSNAEQAAFGQWAHRDADRARRWLQRQPASKARDQQYLMLYLAGVRLGDPDARVLEQIDDAELRAFAESPRLRSRVGNDWPQATFAPTLRATTVVAPRR